MIDTTPASSGPLDQAPNLSVTAARIYRRLKRAHDWQQEIDDVMAVVGLALDVHRVALFRWRDVEGQGFSQSIASLWGHEDIRATTRRPTMFEHEVFTDDPSLARLSQNLRRGKIFAGHTRELAGVLGAEFELQRIVSFLSTPVFVNGNLWGDLAINDCKVERDWTMEEKAAAELVAAAIGDAIERTQSDAHVSEVSRRALLETSLDAIVVIDESGGIVEFNPAAEKVFGWRQADIIGKDMLHTLIPPYYRKGYSNGAEYMAGRGKPMIGRRIETVSTRASGEVFPIELTVAEVRVGGRRLLFGSIRDMSEQIRAEEEINRQRDRLHQNEKMAAMGSLLAGVSHELNNPLAVVVAQSTLLHEFSSDPQTKVRAEKVRAAAERCGRIVKSFLGMVRLQPGAETETDLNQIIRSALEVTAYGARSSGITIDTDFAEGGLLVVVEADHITQVAANFLVNSQHALAAITGDRRIRVRTWRSAAGQACFSVEDNGPGVPETLRERIFEPYFTTKPVGVGTGIGLSISKSIVERHKGVIRYEQVEPRGARFVVELPMQATQAPGAAAAALPPQQLRHALIIDDEPDVAGSLADILELMGVKSVVVASWEAARQALEARRPDIVFSDLRMPGVGGMQIYRTLCGDRPELARRFVLVTGDMIGARAELGALPRGPQPLVLEKPFSTLDVREILAEIGDQMSVK